MLRITFQNGWVNAPAPRQWSSFELEIRETDAAVREIRETPTFAHSDLCDCAPLSACRKLIRAEHAQFFAANDALAVFFNLLSDFFDLRFQRRAVVANVLGERGQTLSSSISTITRGFPEATARDRKHPLPTIGYGLIRNGASIHRNHVWDLNEVLGLLDDRRR